ncbi:MAG: alpha/beta fold hydrolase [Rhodospirillaceae bacterium]|jgi:phospholipase/carboxylesterase|nr:alpha/beta fold hydrolase [Rhodospirillaceae bacterium]MBT5047611.1 alpha/beta fold hydrolase [Rhodospirillaceae bacterium]MBT5457442.1 alpha/beta fold hydrolase [Rhodospirillaceae bacterium]
MSDLPELTGPSFGPAAGGDPQQLVILLHGYGANGDDLIGLAPAFAQVLPNAEFLSPNAPYPCEANPFGGLQWFEVWQQEGVDRLAQVRNGTRIVDAFIDAELAKRGLSDDKLVLIGFSQGTMLSLHVGMRRKAPCAGILGYSGRLESPETLAGEITAKPPVLMIHGEEDPMLAVDLMDKAAETLRENGVLVETHRCPGLGHGIDEDGIRLGAGFLTVHLTGG